MRAISLAQNVKESQRSNSGRPTREKERKSTLIARANIKPIIQTDLVPRVFAAGQFKMADKTVASCNYCEMSTVLLSVSTSNHNPLRAQCDSWGAFILCGKSGENFLLKGAEQIDHFRILTAGLDLA